MGQVFLKVMNIKTKGTSLCPEYCKKSVSFTEDLPWYNECKFIAWEVFYVR